MEDVLKSRNRTLDRCYQCCRFEEELWSMAYECVWPVIRKALPECQTEQDLVEDTERALATNLARRA